MIQRIQTIFLLLIVAIFVTQLLIPLGSVAAPVVPGAAVSVPFYLYNLVAALITAVVVAGLAFATIFLYKNRPLQVRLCQVNILLSAVLICLVLVFPASMMKLPDTAVVHFGAGAWLTIGNTVFNFLAARAINKDEQLVRSADRLR